MLNNISKYAYIDYEYTGERITSAGIVVDNKEYHFKIGKNLNYNNHMETNCLIITEVMLAQNIIILCTGKILIHYGGVEDVLTELIINRQVGAFNKKVRFQYVDFQKIIKEQYDLPCNPSLKDLNGYFDNPYFKAHVAVEDAKALRECVIKYKGYSKYYKPIVRKAMHKERFLKAVDLLLESGYSPVEILKEEYHLTNI